MVGNLKKITVFFKFPTVFLRKKEEEKGKGEGKFLTFVFFLEENRRIEIRNIKMKRHCPQFCVNGNRIQL